MRPVNLIPPDERRGDSAPLRMGNLIYVLVGGLAVLLLGIVVVAVTGKQIKDREAEKVSLQQELAQVTVQAQTVQAFTDFRTVQENRAATVSSLAQSRFDWSRVLQELARVTPSDIVLSSLTGVVSPDVQVSTSSGSSSSGSSGGTDLSGSITGPSLHISGCAPGQDAVAGFVSALEDIDGVTRVGLGSSKLPEQTAAPTGEPGNAPTGGTGDCQAGPNIAKFDIVVAFDAVATPSTATTVPSVPAPSTPPTSGNQVADGQTQENVARASVQEQTSKANAKAHAVLKAGG